MTVFLSRSGWNALPANRDSPLRAETSMVFIHHSAVAKPASIDDAKAQWAAFQTDHLQRPISDTNPTPWADIAYNIGIGPGVILEGRGWDVKGGGTGKGTKIAHHSGSWDNVSVSICVLGYFHPPINDELDALTRETLVAALAEARTRYGDGLAVMGDRDVNTTSCCGDNLYPLLNELWVQSALKENDDMAISDEDAKKIAEAVWSRQVDAAGFQAPAAQMLASIYDEIKKLPRGAGGTLTYDDVLRAVTQEMKRQAAIIAAT